MIDLTWNGTKHTAQLGFSRLGPGKPDAFAFEWEGGAAVALCNGFVDPANPSKALGPLTGEVTGPGIGTGLPWGPIHVTLHDGCMRVFRMGDPPPAMALPESYAEFILDGWSDIPRETRTAILKRLDTYNFAFDDAKYGEPDQAGSPRVIQAIWSGALAYAVGHRADEALAASRAVTDQQSRPCVYYGPDGKPLDRADVWIDEQGWRKGQHGKLARPSASPLQLEDDEHLAPDRFLLAAAAGDPVAIWYCGHYINALLSRPGFASVYVTQQARAVGYRFETLAKWSHVFGDADGRLKKAASNLLASLDLSRGVGINGVPFMALWPAATIHTTHVGPTPLDCIGFASQHGLTIPADITTVAGALKWLSAELGVPMTDTGQLQWTMRGGTSWGAAIIRRGAWRAMSAGLLLWNDKLLEDARDFLVERCAAPGTLPDGSWVVPKALHESVAPRCWRVYPYSGSNGTDRYAVPGLLVQSDKALRGIAFRLYVSHSSFRLSDKSLAAIETAGLHAIAEFGVIP